MTYCFFTVLFHTAYQVVVTFTHPLRPIYTTFFGVNEPFGDGLFFKF